MATVEKRFERMLAKSREFQTSTYIRKFVAPDFQKMIRAEAGAFVGITWVVADGKFAGRRVRLGECACVTCGKIHAWKKQKQFGKAGVDTGHFVASRCNSIIFEETNAHPQCVHCNQYLGGNQEAYSIWMWNVYGQEEIDRLNRLRNESVQFTREDLVYRRINYRARLKVAVDAIGVNK